jgi:hypothetical protein
VKETAYCDINAQDFNRTTNSMDKTIRVTWCNNNIESSQLMIEKCATHIVIGVWYQAYYSNVIIEWMGT